MGAGRRVKLVVQYDGTAYHGFQRQRNLRTIQEELERAAFSVLGEEVGIVAAGRTDAGVHARGQVVSFTTDNRMPVGRMPPAFNRVLPRDIAVSQAQNVPAGFHPRYDAKTKVYRYSLWCAEVRSPFWRSYAYHVRHALDREAMRRASMALLGSHDFSSFCAAGGSVCGRVRTVSSVEWADQGELFHFLIEADGFLYNMVRIIVGTLLLVGRGRFSPEDFRAVLGARDRSRAGPTAPPHGLCLEEVKY